MDFMKEYKNVLVGKFKILSSKDRKKMAVMSMERQFKAYCNFAINKSWNRVEEYRFILDECWKSILEDTNLEEQTWNTHENIRPENIRKSVEEEMEINVAYANIFSNNVSELIDNLIDEMGNEEGFLMLNIGYIISYLNERNIEKEYKIDEYKENQLIQNEIKKQDEDYLKCKEIIINFLNVQDWCKNCKNLLNL